MQDTLFQLVDFGDDQGKLAPVGDNCFMMTEKNIEPDVAENIMVKQGFQEASNVQIIEELESSQRGPYAGAVGYFSFSGNMDFCIVIRTLLIKNDTRNMTTK